VRPLQSLLQKKYFDHHSCQSFMLSPILPDHPTKKLDLKELNFVHLGNEYY